jgi:hypothetical protein
MGNQHHNMNQNVEKISTKIQDEGLKITVVTRRGARTGNDVTTGGKQVEKWIKKLAGSYAMFNPHQEKETYKKEIKEFLGPDWVASTSAMLLVVDMPLVYDQTILEGPLEKVSTLKEFLKSCLQLMKDDFVLNTLCKMIINAHKKRNFHIIQRVVNQVMCKKRTNGEFRLSAQIGEYDVDNVILDLGSDVNVLPKQTLGKDGEA